MKLRCLLLGRKVMTNLDSILKSRDITLPTEVCLVKATVFSSSHIWLWSWTIKKAECQRIDAFELWCWRRLLRVVWTARRSNQSILKVFLKENLPPGLVQPADASCRADSLLPGSFQGLPSNHKATGGPAFLQGWWDLCTRGRVSGSQEGAQMAISGWEIGRVHV